MLDLHLELANLYYPDAWGAQAERAARNHETHKAKDAALKRELYHTDREYRKRKTASERRWRATPKGRESMRAYMRKYRANPETKAKLKAYEQTPERRATSAARNKRYRETEAYKLSQQRRSEKNRWKAAAYS